MKASTKLNIIGKSFLNKLVGKRQDPIFILGTGRCGSTLLVDILATNSDIQIDQNEQYDWFLVALNGGKGKRHNPIYTDIINYDLTAKKSLELWTPYYRSKLRIMIDRKINQNDKTFFLKSPAITFLLPEIKKLYPKAKYVHLYRNGYAVARSWFKKEYFRDKDYQDNFTEDEFILECAKYYNASILNIQDFLKEVKPGNQFSLSYEKLTEQPDYELPRLLKFAGIDSKCAFDLSTINSTNHKIDKIEETLKYQLNLIMKDSLKALGYY